MVPHPDGGVWFTDPPYGGQLYEGAPDAAGGPSNAGGQLNPRLGQAAGIGEVKRRIADECLPRRSRRPGRNRCHRGAGAGSEQTRVLARLQAALCDQYGKGPGDSGAGGKGDVHVFDVGVR